MAAALLAYDATVTTDRREALDHRRAARRRLQRRAPTTRCSRRNDPQRRACRPAAGERALYKRAISRSYAEWPLVEVCARAVIADGAFQFIRIAAGGIAPVPLRLAGVGSRACRAAGQRRDDRRGGERATVRREAAADDGLQARSAERRRAAICWSGWRRRHVGWVEPCETDRVTERD